MLSITTQQNISQLLSLGHQSLDEQTKLFDSLEELSLQVTLDLVLEHLDKELAKQFLELIQVDETGEKAIAFAKEHISSFENLLQVRMTEELSALAKLS